MNNVRKRLEQIITLKNSEEYKQLDRYYNKRSFFNILRIARSEVHHDNFLLWLLSPSESHELGDFALRKLLETFVLVKNKLQAENEKLKFPDGIEDDIVCGSYILEDVVCKRQYKIDNKRILDLFISFTFASRGEEAESKKINIIIENKVEAKEGKKQTSDYYEYGKSLEGETIYLFLSPIQNSEYEELSEPVCDCKHFIGLNYQYLADNVLEPSLSECVQSEPKIFIEEYLRALSQPSLQEDNNGGIIMAVSKRERELLRNFWDSNEELLSAAITALADDPDLEPESREKISVALEVINSTSRNKTSEETENGRKNVYEWFWEYAENNEGRDFIRKTTSYKVPKKGYRESIMFTTVNFIKAFKLKEGISDNPPEAQNIAMQYILTTRTNVTISIAPLASVDDATDDEKEFIKGELEVAFNRRNMAMPNTGSWNAWFSQKLIDSTPVETITKEEFFEMLNTLKIIDNEMFG